MLLAIYKMNYTLNCRYAERGFFGEEDCQHVAFHSCMRTMNQARIAVSQDWFCAGKCLHCIQQ